MKALFYRLHSDSLFRNSFYLMLATAVMAAFGFFFWFISARLASPQDIGIATALISVMNMIAILSLIGFDSAIVRFLHHSTQRNDKLNTGIILVGIASIILSGFFVLYVQHISPELAFIKNNIFIAGAFMVFCVMSAINILTDAVFLAYRQTKFSLIINTVFSIIKMVLPFAFASWGAFGIFSAAAVGQSVGFILSIAIMMWKFDYRPQFIINRDVIKEIWYYCIGNYFAGILNLLPATLVPIIILNHLGSAEAAYFYIVAMIGNLLYVIPQAATKSLFAESSHSEHNLAVYIKKSVRVITFLMLPAIIFIILSGKYVLEFFGKNYSNGGLNFLYLIAISGIAVSAYSISSSIFRVKKNLQALIITNVFYAGTIISLSYFFLPFGLVGIGYAWLLGNVVASFVGWTMHYLFISRKMESNRGFIAS